MAEGKKDIERSEEADDINLENLSEVERAHTIDVLKKKMLNFAKDLKFEDAAIIRDKMQKIEGLKNEKI